MLSVNRLWLKIQSWLRVHLCAFAVTLPSGRQGRMRSRRGVVGVYLFGGETVM